MEPIVPLAIGVAAVATAALVALRRRPPGRPTAPAVDEPAVDEPAASAPAAGPAVLRPSRIVVVGDPRPSTGLHPHDASGRVGPGVDPRRRLLRDASAVLVVVAAIALIASFLPPGAGESGGVLSATGTPGAGAPIPQAGTGTGTAPSGGTTDTSGSAAGEGPAGQPAVTPSAGGQAGTPRATPVPRPGGPSASRLAVLTPCPGRSDCYLYVVRQGDTLSGLSTFFGVRMETILRLNPQITDPSIIVRGSTLVLPTPTR